MAGSGGSQGLPAMALAMASIIQGAGEPGY